MKLKQKTSYVNGLGAKLRPAASFAGVGAATLLLQCTALGASYTWDFTKDPTTNAVNPIAIYQAQTFAYKDSTGVSQYWKPTGGNPGGFLGLTWPLGSASTICVFPDIDQQKLVTAFKLDADLRVGNPQQSTRAADGFSVNFARSSDDVFSNPDPSSFATSGAVETGTKTGISIIFDTWAGNDLPDGRDFPDSDPAGGIIVRVDNKTVKRYEMPLYSGACDDATSLQTGPREEAFWTYWRAHGFNQDPGATDLTANPPISPDAAFLPDSWSNLCWQHLSVELDNASKLTVIWKGTTVLDHYQTDFFPSAGGLVLAGRTGGADEHTHFDNLTLTTTATAADTVPPTVPGALTAVSTGSGRVQLSWTASTDNSGRVGYEISRDGVVLINAAVETNYVDYPPQPNKAYTYKVRAVDVSNNFSDYATLAVTTVAEIALAGTVKVEIYDGIQGTAISDLTGDASFPNGAQRDSYTLGLSAGNPNGNAGWNGSFGDNLGIRMTGVLVPSETGQFDFFIRSDDSSAFYLNTSGAALPDTATATPLVHEDGCCHAFLEPTDAANDGKTTSQPISLTAGNSYGFVVLMKEGGGGDGVAVGMRKAGDTTPAASLPAIGGLNVIGQNDPVGAVLNITTQPGNQTIIANEAVKFSVVATNSSPYGAGIWYQWLRNGAAIPGAISSSYTIPVVATADNSAKFSVAVGTIGIVKTSSVATLTVTTDTKKPHIAGAVGTESLDTVTIKFSEPVTDPTATTAANYTFSGGVTATAASRVDQFTIKLTTSKQAEGTVYTLTVNNVADNAGNAIAANSSLNYKSWGLVPNRAKEEIWLNISGTTMDLLYGDAHYADAPDVVRYVSGMNTGGDYADNYGARVKAYLIPKESGSYNFFLTSDDASELYVSSNDTFPTVPGATPVAQETDCCDAFAEPGTKNDDGTTSPTTATPIALVGGTRYAIQAMLKEGTGGDNVRVAERKVGDPTPAGELQPMSADVYWLGPEINVLATNNTIVPSSTNSPAAEISRNVLDGNSATKYLNFDKLNTGFTVTPASASTLHGIALTSANDAPERDPASFKIEGSVDDGATWATVAQGTVDVFPDRFTRREYYFNNNTAYTVYRVTFPTVANASAANSMQIADVELLGFFGGTLASGTPGGPKLTIGRTGANISISWSGGGVLQSALAVSTSGTAWTDVTGATSPYTNAISGTAKYYRVKQ